MSLEYYECRRHLKNIAENAMSSDIDGVYGIETRFVQEAREFLEKTNRKVTTSKGE